MIIFSPNYSKKPRNIKEINFIIIHYTGMQSKRVSIKRLTDKKSKVSCHYLIDRSGKLYSMVEDSKVAWHAGKSKWKRYKNLNRKSIGIELVNKGHKFGYQAFPPSQIRSLIKLCKNLKKKYKIKNSCVLGHSDIAPLRKKDPGEKFPWHILFKKNLSVWPLKKINQIENKFKKKYKKLFFKNIYKIGYRYFNKNYNKSSKNNKLVVKAFQRKFSSKTVDGIIDQKTYEISHYLANQIKI